MEIVWTGTSALGVGTEAGAGTRQHITAFAFLPQAQPGEEQISSISMDKIL